MLKKILNNEENLKFLENENKVLKSQIQKTENEMEILKATIGELKIKIDKLDKDIFDDFEIMDGEKKKNVF